MRWKDYPPKKQQQQQQQQNHHHHNNNKTIVGIGYLKKDLKHTKDFLFAGEEENEVTSTYTYRDDTHRVS